MRGSDSLSILPKSTDAIGLDRIKNALFSMQLNRASFPWIHVAGTKGKGSVSVYLANIFKSSGYKVGLFLSPHLQSREERFSINLNPISKDEFEKLYAEVTAILPEIQLEQMHYFEILTLLCFYYFTKQQVEIAVIETGLGGRKDATTAVENPILTVITNLGFDHMERLGMSLESITYEKAGILKTEVPLVTAKQPEVSKLILDKEAKLMRSTTYFLDEFVKIERKKPANSVLPEFFSVYSHKTKHLYEDLSTDLLGQHQTNNASLALLSAEVIKKDFPKITYLTLREGIKKTFIPGRFEIVKDVNYQETTILLDGAHNPDSAKALVETLLERYPHHNILFLVCFLKNKLAKEIISSFSSVGSFFQFTSLSNHDTYKEDDYKLLWESANMGLLYQYEESAIKAYRKVLSQAKSTDLVCITGSMYLVGLIRDYIGYLPCSSYEQDNGGV